MKEFIVEYREDNLRLLFPETTEKKTVVYMCGPQGPHIAVGYQAYSDGLEIYVEKDVTFGDLFAKGDIKVYTDEVYTEDDDIEELFILQLTAEGLEKLEKRCEELDEKIIPIINKMLEAYKKM